MQKMCHDKTYDETFEKRKTCSWMYKKKIFSFFFVPTGGQDKKRLKIRFIKADADSRQ